LVRHAGRRGFLYLISDDPTQIVTDYDKLWQIEEDYLYHPEQRR